MDMLLKSLPVSVEDLSAEFSKLKVTRPFPRMVIITRFAYTINMLSDLSKFYKEVDDEQQCSELVKDTDESQWLDMLLKSLPVSGFKLLGWKAMWKRTSFV